MAYVRPEVPGLSPLATYPVAQRRDVGDRESGVYGIAVHCTGSGVVDHARERGRPPLDYAIEYYARPDSYFAHYVIGFEGELAQITDEHEKAQHIGYPKEEHQALLNGSWATILPAAYVRQWRERWPQCKGPAYLFPGPSPNDVYVGVELLVWQEGCASNPLGAGKYTPQQYATLIDLCSDIALRWEFPDNWQNTGRLACHEDLNPLSRTSHGEGWDPGVIRAQPHFDWGYFTRGLAVALGK